MPRNNVLRHLQSTKDSLEYSNLPESEICYQALTNIRIIDQVIGDLMYDLLFWYESDGEKDPYIKWVNKMIYIISKDDQ